MTSPEDLRAQSGHPGHLVVALGVLGGMASQSELAGNAAGELWAFLPLEVPARLARIDKVSGAETVALPLGGFPRASDIDAFAFTTWGGEFCCSCGCTE